MLLLSFISMGVYSQRIIKTKKFCDSRNNIYVKTLIHNNTRKTITCLVFTIQYAYPSMWDTNQYKGITVKVNIKPGAYQIITYYPPENHYEPIGHSLDRVIFYDGSYRDF